MITFELSPSTEAQATISPLLEIMRELRDPSGGCPWDVEQDFASIAPFTVEEAYEVADAIARENMPDLLDELGDLLLQVVFHAQIAAERDLFTFSDVVAAIVDKMIRRHPHVFADEKVLDAADQTRAWEAIKARERGPSASVLDGVSSGIAPLLRAEKLQRRAAKVGFDWVDRDGVTMKLDEELAELKAARTPAEIEAELGDLLFTCVNYARHTHIDASQALLKANLRFERRFRHMEEASVAQPLEHLSAVELDNLWRAAKAMAG
jgi:nucleoside triphosphate diphosphatase